jgi:hypothetical protein
MREQGRGGTQKSAVEQAVRDQEVLRANRELAAYFKGRRTEREARAALKIIKAFVRDRERQDSRSRPPLPGVNSGKIPKRITKREATGAGSKRQRTLRRKSSGSAAAVNQPLANAQPSASPDTDEQAS